jgi:hypothetical protein
MKTKKVSVEGNRSGQVRNQASPHYE